MAGGRAIVRNNVDHESPIKEVQSWQEFVGKEEVEGKEERLGVFGRE